MNSGNAIQCSECGKLLPPHLPLGLCPSCALRGASELSVEKKASQATSTCRKCGRTSASEKLAEGLCGECAAQDENKKKPMPQHTAYLPDPPSSFSEFGSDRIGRYKLLQKIGEGGCGIVFMAEQSEPIRRKVALKVIKLGMDTRSVIARFEAERQALALMEHPNIAKVLDAGATEVGRPYFVMELVRGVKITDYCDQNQLSTAARLKLFVQVCQAVQHAHQKGIIHRDLKPSNILVTMHDGVPVPKVIDFGIAKATTGQPLTDKTLFTALEQFMGTPAYMSPEQAEMSGLDIDTRTDIYSLGVLMYELLVGQTPFDPRKLWSRGFEEMRRTIREEESHRPSTRLGTLTAEELNKVARARGSEAPRLIGIVSGDLDWIAMKCLEKDRTRRYESASGLAKDIECYLTNEPVLARPPTGFYRLQKFVRRRKGLVATTLIVVGAILSGLAMATVGFLREQAAHKDAEFRRTEAISSREEARRRAYISDMNLASQSLRLGDLGAARAYVRRQVPKPGEKDWRNWEWRYLARECVGDSHEKLAYHNGPISNIRFLDKNTLVSTGFADWRTVFWDVRHPLPQTVLTNTWFGGGVGWPMVIVSHQQQMLYRYGTTASHWIQSVNLKTGTETNYLKRPDAISSIDMSPDEKILAIARDNEIELIHLDGAQLTNSHLKTIHPLQVLFSPDGSLLAAGCADGHLDFWSYPSFKVAGFAQIAPWEIGSLAFAPDGQSIAATCGGAPTNVFIWSLKTHSLSTSWKDSVSARCSGFSGDGRWFVVAGGDTSVRVWDTTRWIKRTLHGHMDPVLHLAFQPGSDLLATAARDGELLLWHLNEKLLETNVVSFPESDWIKASKDGSTFARTKSLSFQNGSAHADEVELWSTRPLKHVASIAVNDLAIDQAQVMPTASGLMISCADGSIHYRRVGNVPDLVLTNVIVPFEKPMDVSGDGSVLAASWSTMKRGVLRTWRVPQMELIDEAPNKGNILSVVISPNGQTLTGFSGPGDITLWKLNALSHPIQWHGFDPLQSVIDSTFSPDASHAAMVLQQGSAFIWNLATHERLVLPRAQSTYLSVSYSKDGTRLAVGSREEAKVFDAVTGEEIIAFDIRNAQLTFLENGEDLLCLQPNKVSILNAPQLRSFKEGTFMETTSDQIPPYNGPPPPTTE